jgi:hypothetical protein
VSSDSQQESQHPRQQGGTFHKKGRQWIYWQGRPCIDW